MLVLPERLTHEEAPACCRMLAQAMRADPGGEARVDAAALSVFDSSALAVLLECRREALSLGKTFRVSRMPARLGDLAALYGVAELVGSEAAQPTGSEVAQPTGGEAVQPTGGDAAHPARQAELPPT
jgi:phospholipid transport system transporter-binding protein